MRRFLIQCVVVLYKQCPKESKALSSLVRLCISDAVLGSQIAILVQDNSPQAQECVFDSPESAQSNCWEYDHVPANLGLAHAYNCALSLARERSIPWLLLLDQDTQVTEEFLIRLLESLRETSTLECCAFVPQLVLNDLVLSPQIVNRVFYQRMPIGFSGLASKRLVAFNSGACIRVSSLTAIGGFPNEFWLDYLDHMIFHSLQESGGRVFVLDSRLEHSLSVADIESNVSNERYNNLLQAEWMFVRKTKWGGGPIVHRIRLLKRAISHLLKLRSKSYALQTLRSACS
jgi:GT2 family glycosyltransferase